MSETLKVSVEDLGPCRKRVKVVVPSSRVQAEVESGFKNASRHINVPGFRPGHVPRKIVEQRFGPAIRREIKETLIQDSYREAVEEKKLAPLGSPEIDFEKIDFAETKALEFEVAVDVRPTIELKTYKGIEIQREKVAVAASEIDDQIKGLRRQGRRPVKDEGGAIGEEGFAICAVEFFQGSESVLKKEAVRVAPFTPVVGTEAEAFKKAMIGKKKDENFQIPCNFPADFDVEAARGKKGKVTVSVSEVYKFLEPQDEEILKAFDFPDMETMRKETEKTILAHKEEQEDRRIENAILDEIIKTHKFELPERIVHEQSESALARFRQLKEAEGVTGEALAAELAAKQKESQENAVKQVKGFFLVDAIARKEKLFVTDEEMFAELQNIAARNQSSLEEVKNYYQQQNLLPMLRMDLIEKKVRGFLRESAKIK